MRYLVQFCLILCTCCGIVDGQQAEPVMDFATLLSAVDVKPDGRLQLEHDNEPLKTVFLPEAAQVVAQISKAGTQKPIHTQDFYKSRGNKVFSFLQARGKYKEFIFSEPGDYVLTFRSGSKVLTQLPFRLAEKSNADEFDPKTIWYTQGPWSEMAYVHCLRGKGEDANVEFRMWGQRPDFEDATVTDKYDVVLKKEGDIVAESKTGYVGTTYWLRLAFQMRHPSSKGGRTFTFGELTARDGDYQFVVSKNGKLHAVFPMQIRGGKPVLHPRQANNYQPRHDYIIPRYSNMHAGINDIGNTYWMSRLPDAEANAVASATAAEVAGPTKAQLKRWNWLPHSIDPKRKFEFKVTDVATRTDTGFAVGEDLVVFGTGHPSGVKYLKAGDLQAREIPEGETWSSKLFGVCGNKIVLTKRNQVAIFDSSNGRLTKIPTSEISLYNPSNLLMNCNGFLVATVNKATDVTDRNVIKIIDISQDQPVIISIKNSSYTHDQVSSVAVDAKNGTIAVALSATKQIAAAKIAPLANQHVFDISEYRGVSRFQISIEGEQVVYADEDWKVRSLKLGEPPKAITQEPIARSGNGFWLRKGRLVTVTKNDKVGTRYPMMIADLDDVPQLVPGTGTAIKGTSAHLGLGGSAAIALDKSVFIAGNAGDSIRVGERLQILTENGWVPILGEDGKPVWGSEVVTSMGFMALKVRNASGKTVIGYATYGETIDFPSGKTKPAVASTSKGKSAELLFADDNPYNTHDEQLYGRLQAFLENEKQIAEAYIPAFGKEAGTKKVIEGVIKSMKDSGNESLVDDYLRASSLVTDADRPKTGGEESTLTNSAVLDPVDVRNYLTGQWKAIRFSAQGKDLPDSAVENLTLTFGNDKYVMNMGAEIQTGTFEIDTSTNPMSMTVHIGNGSNKGQKRNGSFKLLKDKRLLLVFGTDEQTKPTKFVPNKEGHTIMAVYQKVQ